MSEEHYLQAHRDASEERKSREQRRDEIVVLASRWSRAMAPSELRRITAENLLSAHLSGAVYVSLRHEGGEARVAFSTFMDAVALALRDAEARDGKLSTRPLFSDESGQPIRHQDVVDFRTAHPRIALDDRLLNVAEW